MTDFQIFALLAPPGLVLLVAVFVLTEEYFNRRQMRLETTLGRMPESFVDSVPTNSADAATRANSVDQSTKVDHDVREAQHAETFNRDLTNQTVVSGSASDAAKISRNIQQAMYQDAEAFFAGLDKLATAKPLSEAVLIQYDIRARTEAFLSRARSTAEYVGKLVEEAANDTSRQSPGTTERAAVPRTAKEK